MNYITNTFSKEVFILIVFLGTLQLSAQDAHFTQYMASPLTLNPALVGTAPGSYRVAVNYRDQWRGALDNSLKTFSAAGDLKFEMGTEEYGDFAGAGFMFYSDRVGLFDLNTNQLALVGSYQKSLNPKKKEYIGGGLSFGLTQKSINYEDLTFQDEFNAINAFTLPSGEILPQNSLSFLDLSIGLSYLREMSDDLSIYTGLSYAHLNSPNVSFYQQVDNPNPELIRSSILDPKWSFYVGGSMQTTRNISVQPRLLFLSQGPYQEAVVGSNVKMRLDDRNTTFVHFGPWVRGVNNYDGFGMESIMVSAGYEKNGFIIGLSYDHMLSDLLNDRVGLNTLELSMTFIGNYENEDNFCPTF